MPIAASNGTFSEPARTDGYHDMRIISPESDALPGKLILIKKFESKVTGPVLLTFIYLAF